VAFYPTRYVWSLVCLFICVFPLRCHRQAPPHPDDISTFLLPVRRNRHTSLPHFYLFVFFTVLEDVYAPCRSKDLGFIFSFPPPVNKEHEYRKHLAELDAALTAAVPQAGLPCHTHDLAWKSSGTPVRYFFKLPVPVDTAGSHVAYRFASDEFDIGFAVFFQGAEEGAKLETVLPSSRVDSHVEPVSGDITVHRPGTVVLLWDNSYRCEPCLLGD